MKNRFKIIYFLFFTFSMLGCTVLFKKDTPFIPEKEIHKMLIKHWVNNVSFAIIKSGKIVSIQSYERNGTQASKIKNPVFEGASLSKPVFAYGVLKMVEDGALSLDEPISNYLEEPDLKNDLRYKKITARMILSHKSGLPNWREKHKDLKIYFNHGEKFSYSGEGYFLLQKIVKKLSGESLDQYMKNTVFTPLQMHNSCYLWEDKYNKNHVSGYDSYGHLLKGLNSDQLANAAFTLHTTASDYIKFIQAILNSHGLQEDTFNQMLMPQINVSKEGPFCIKHCSKSFSSSITWGLGWGLQKIKNHTYFWHWGDNSGFKCYVFAERDKGNALVIFTNSDKGINFISEFVYKMTGLYQPAFTWLHYK